MSNMEPIAICRDEDCPQCDWPETYAECTSNGPTAFGCRQCGWRQELGNDPRFPKAYVPMGRFVAVDAWGHLMMEVCAELRRHGADEDTVKKYREAALINEGGPYAETPRWVRVTKDRSN